MKKPINQCRKTFLKAYLLERRGRIDLLLQAVDTSRLRSKRSYSRLTFARKKKDQISNIKTRLRKNQSKPDSKEFNQINQKIRNMLSSITCTRDFFHSWKKKNLAIAIAIHVSGARFRRRRNPSYMYLNTLESKQSGYGIRTPGIEIGRSR